MSSHDVQCESKDPFAYSSYLGFLAKIRQGFAGGITSLTPPLSLSPLWISWAENEGAEGRVGVLYLRREPAAPLPGGSCGVHSWIESASGDGRRVSWFEPQNQGGGRRSKTPSRGGTGVGLGTDGGDGRRRRLGPRCGRGGDGRRAASRAVRRPRRERRPGPRRGDGNLPARGVLAVFSKPATYPGFADSPKTANRIFIHTAASRRRLRLEERTSTVG